MSTAPFFIVGSGRSGSTLLRVMMAAHPRILIPPETWFLIPLVETLPLDRPLTPTEIEQAARIVTGHYRWPDMGIPTQEFRQRLAGLRATSLRDVAEVVYLRLLKDEADKGKVRWGDKTPPYVKILPQLATVFPDALFIHLFRDGRDVAKSFQARGWYGRWLHDNTKEWNEAIDYATIFSRSEWSDRMMPVRYADLVVHPERILRDICRFLGEEYDPAMLAYQATLGRRIPSREAVIHGKLKRAPRESDVFRWKREMTRHEVWVAEAFMGMRLKALGYERRHRSISLAPLLALTRAYCCTVLPAVEFARRGLRFVQKRLWRPAAPSAESTERR
jgi:Sulfotransferase family